MKMEHLTISVKNLEESIRFYQRVLQLKVLGDLRNNGLPIVFLGDKEADPKIELIEDKTNGYCGSGISAGFYAEDFMAAHERIKCMEYRVSDIVSPAPNVQFFFVADPDGFSIQIMESK